jgi:integrase
MAGKAKGPWKWGQRNRWCATINGKRVPLDADPDDEKAAWKEWHERMAARDRPARRSEDLPVRSVLTLHDDFVKDNRAAHTYDWYVRHSKSFCKAHGHLTVGEFRPHHIDSWVGSHEWAASTRRGAISAIKIAFAWAKKRGYIESNPIEGIERPHANRRQAIISTDQLKAFRDEMKDGAFRDLFMAVLETGCRPGEACKVEARHFDPQAGTWTLHGKTTSRTGKLRVVYLTDAMIEMSARLAKCNPSGAMFRNSQGTPWTRHSYGHRVRRMREKLKLGREVVLSSLRHLFITDSLERGVPIATVAEVVGHSNVTMISQVYSMLHQRSDHLREAVNKVRGVSSRDRTSGHIGEASEPPQPSPSAPPDSSPRKRRGPKP